MDREGVRAYIRRIIAQSGMTGKLIAVNTAVFLVFLIITLIDTLFISGGNVDGVVPIAVQIKTYFVAPGDPSQLLYQPWSIITQMFTHADFGHFIFNMLVLFFAGRIFVQFFGERRLLSTYIIGGIVGYLVHLLAYYTLPIYADAPYVPGILGASGSIFAIFIAAAAHRPSFIVHFFGVIRVPLFIIGALYVVSTLLKLGTPGHVAHFAHLGGAIFGALSVINAHSSSNFMNRLDRFIFQLKLSNFSFKRKPKMKVYESSKAAKMTDDEYNADKVKRKERIDAILDKISKKGYEGLTKEEKDILFNESKR